MDTQLELYGIQRFSVRRKAFYLVGIANGGRLDIGNSGPASLRISPRAFSNRRMSLEAGAKRSAVGFPFLIWFKSKDNKWESGRPAFGFPLFHAEPAQDLPRRGVPAIRAPLFAFGVGSDLRHSTGPVKVQVRIEVAFIEGFDG